MLLLIIYTKGYLILWVLFAGLKSSVKKVKLSLEILKVEIR